MSVRDTEDQVETRFAVLACQRACDGVPANTILVDLIDQENVFREVVKGGNDDPLALLLSLLIVGVCFSHGYARRKKRSGNNRPSVMLSGKG